METSTAEITTQAEPEKADANTGEASGGESAPPVKVADTSEDTSSWTEKAQKRYDELTRKAYEAQGERDRERYQRESLQAELAALKAAAAKTSEVAPQETFPTLEQFGYDEGKFNTAVAAHFSKVATEQARTVAREQLQEERARIEHEQATKNWVSKEAEFIKLKPDYVEKVKLASTLPISREIQMELRESDLGPQIAYYLVENPEKATAILALPLKAQLREIGRIEAKLEATKPSAPAVSKAPPPPSKVEASESPAPFDPSDPASDKLSTDEWLRRRNKQLKKR